MKYNDLCYYVSSASVDIIILGIEEYMDTHKKEIVDFVEKKISEKKYKEMKITGEIFDRLVNKLSIDMPFGPTYDMTHIILANALVCSLWCGWLSQAMVNKKEQNRLTISPAFSLEPDI